MLCPQQSHRRGTNNVTIEQTEHFYLSYQRRNLRRTWCSSFLEPLRLSKCIPLWDSPGSLNGRDEKRKVTCVSQAKHAVRRTNLRFHPIHASHQLKKLGSKLADSEPTPDDVNNSTRADNCSLSFRQAISRQLLHETLSTIFGTQQKVLAADNKRLRRS